MKTYKIHLIRHGLTDANRRGIYCGSTDLPLDESGISSLHELLDSAVYPYAELVFSSPLRRAVQTAEILFPGVEIVEIENLREVSFGEFEGKSMTELKSHPDYARFAVGDRAFSPKGAESPDAFFNRSAAAGAAVVGLMIQAGVHSAAVVTHASVIGNILSAIGYPKAPPYDWNPPPGGGYTAVADISLFLREPVIEVLCTIPEYAAPDVPDDGADWDDDSWDEILK